MSKAFANPKDAGLSSKRLVDIEVDSALQLDADGRFSLQLDNELIAESIAGASIEAVKDSLAQMRESD